MGCVCAWQRSVSAKDNKFLYLTRAEGDVIARLELGTSRPQHPILFRGSNNISPLWPDTDHWLHIHGALRERRDEFYTAASLKTHFATTPKTCIIKCLINSGFFYLIRTAKYSSYQSIPNWCNLGLELVQTTLSLFIDHTSDDKTPHM